MDGGAAPRAPTHTGPQSSETPLASSGIEEEKVGQKLKINRKRRGEFQLRIVKKKIGHCVGLIIETPSSACRMNYSITTTTITMYNVQCTILQNIFILYTLL